MMYGLNRKYKDHSYQSLCVFICIFAFTSMVDMNPIYAADRHILTLDQALEVARRQSRHILMAEADHETALGQVKETTSGALPQLHFNSTYQRNLENPAFFTQIDGEPTKFVIGGLNSFTSVVELRQPVYLGGKMRTALKIAKTYSALTQTGIEAVRRETNYRVKYLFHSILLARETAAVARRSYELAQAHHDNVLARFHQGMVSEFELLRAEVGAVNHRPAVLRADNAVQVQLLALKNLLGIDEDLDVRGQLIFEPRSHQSLDAGKAGYLERRPELRQIVMRRKIQELNIKIEGGNSLPSVHAVGQAQFTGQGDRYTFKPTERNLNYYLGLEIEVPLFDGWRTKGRVEQAESRLRKTELEEMQLKDQVQTETTQIYLQIIEAEQRIRALEQIVVQAEKAARIAEVRYANGLSTQLELFDTRLAQDQVQMEYLTGIYDYLIACARWDRAVGISNQ